MSLQSPGGRVTVGEVVVVEEGMVTVAMPASPPPRAMPGIAPFSYSEHTLGGRVRGTPELSGLSAQRAGEKLLLM